MAFCNPKHWLYKDEPFQLRWSTKLRAAFMELRNQLDPHLSLNKAVVKAIEAAVKANHLPGYAPLTKKREKNIIEAGDYESRLMEVEKPVRLNETIKKEIINND